MSEHARQILDASFGDGWRVQKSWCRLFRFPEWVVSTGHFEALYPRKTVTDDGNINVPSIVVPCATVYNIHDKKHWVTQHITQGANGHMHTMVHHHYQISGTRICTDSVSIQSKFLQGRALKINNRYFISRINGPMEAVEAFRMIINQKPKRAHWIEVLVDKEMLRDILALLHDINSRGGYATCTITEADSWFVVRNLTILGNQNACSEDKKHFSDGYEYGKIVPVGFGPNNSMVELIHPPSTVSVTRATKIIPEKSECMKLYSKEKLLVPCRVEGWKVNMVNVEIDRVDREHDVLIHRPLSGVHYEIKNRLSKSNCPEIIQTDEKVVSKNNVLIDETTPMAVLGATVVRPDGHAYIRVKESFRNYLKTQCAKHQHVLVPFYEEVVEAGRHSAGWKGKYPIFRMRLVVQIDGTQYWLDNLLPVSTDHKHNNVRPRYLQLQ